MKINSSHLAIFMLIVSLVTISSCSNLKQGGGIGGTGAKNECTEENMEHDDNKINCSEAIKPK